VRTSWRSRRTTRTARCRADRRTHAVQRAELLPWADGDGPGKRPGSSIARVPATGAIAVVKVIGAYIPYVGAFIGGAFAVLMGLGEGGIGLALIMLGITLVVNLLLENLLEPALLGDSLDMHPLLALLATALGALVAGMVGLILAAPLTEIAIDIQRELKATGFLRRRPTRTKALLMTWARHRPQPRVAVVAQRQHDETPPRRHDGPRVTVGVGRRPLRTTRVSTRRRSVHAGCRVLGAGCWVLGASVTNPHFEFGSVAEERPDGSGSGEEPGVLSAPRPVVGFCSRRFWVPDDVVTRASRLLRPFEPVYAMGRQLEIGQDLTVEIARYDEQLKASKQLIRTAVAASNISLTSICGLGPITAAIIFGHTGNIDRFPTRHRFAGYNATAPIEASSGNRVRHRLNPPGNRKLNWAIQIVATSQLRHDSKGREF
jgi:hypothetical protein